MKKGNLNSASFKISSLIKFDSEDHVVLASGGPLMLLEAIEGENAIVSWEYDGTNYRHMFPVVCLRRLVKL